MNNLSGQSRAEYGQMNHKGLWVLRIRERLVREGRGMERNTLDLLSWVEAVYLDVGCFSSEPV